MAIKFKKLNYQDLPDKARDAILDWSDSEIVIDETILTAPQIAKFTEFLNRLGYK